MPDRLRGAQVSDETEAVAEALLEDLHSATERLYVACKRFVRVFERDLDEEDQFFLEVNLNGFRESVMFRLLESEDAYKRCDAAGMFEFPPEEDEDANA
jgi:hypothetical protein